MAPTLPDAVAALLDAANAHDTDAFLGSFTAGAVVDDWGREFPGAEAIRGWSDAEFIGVQVAGLATDIPQYAVTIEKKVETVRAATVGRIATLISRVDRQMAPAKIGMPAVKIHRAATRTFVP